jgi:hypothetical protein
MGKAEGHLGAAEEMGSNWALHFHAKYSAAALAEIKAIASCKRAWFASQKGSFTI